jgi:hypothetical protein
MNTWTPIHLPIGVVSVLNAGGSLAIFSLVLTHRAVLPGILSADRHFERLAEQADRILLSLLFDELVPHSWFCEKMASAFFPSVQ